MLVDDTDPALVDAVLDRADAALAAGVPVPLFTGGDLGGGPAAARAPARRAAGPGRVVGAPARTDGYAVYEPRAGVAVHRA